MFEITVSDYYSDYLVAYATFDSEYKCRQFAYAIDDSRLKYEIKDSLGIVTETDYQVAMWCGYSVMEWRKRRLPE